VNKTGEKKTKKNIECAKAKFTSAEQSTRTNRRCHVANRYAIAIANLITSLQSQMADMSEYS